ncbi:MAG: signal recognition particle-docking protein FtsY [Chloroflexi bacterium]|nr:MAG: signal recognition particle-docking protein FtsY [Chloroflexota bacterium]
MRLFGRSPKSDEATNEALTRTRKSFFGRIGSLFGGGDVTEELWESLEEVLIGADAGVTTTMDVLDRVRAQRPRDAEAVRSILRDELVAILEGAEAQPKGALWGEGQPQPEAPAVVLIVGVNGTGKTTALARLAHAYQSEGLKVVAAAGDTFRAAAIDQIKHWGERLGFGVIAHQQGSDPAAIVFDAVEAAKARGADLLLIDTAGRLQNKQNLMDELTKIRRVIERHLGRGPDEVALVLDATTGQNGLSQARAFIEAVEVTGVILTKLDGTARGGIVFAIASELGLPVRFIGTGERPEDLAPFEPGPFVDALLATPQAAEA